MKRKIIDFWFKNNKLIIGALFMFWLAPLLIEKANSFTSSGWFILYWIEAAINSFIIGVILLVSYIGELK